MVDQGRESERFRGKQAGRGERENVRLVPKKKRATRACLCSPTTGPFWQRGTLGGCPVEVYVQNHHTELIPHIVPLIVREIQVYPF
jgi:hypothetical protein